VIARWATRGPRCSTSPSAIHRGATMARMQRVVVTDEALSELEFDEQR
jgi:hypothetical protein